jgi:hypothetical protein
MAYHPPRPDHSLDRWLRRLDRAADRMNPFLVVLAIGLVLLNLICVALLASRLPITLDTLALTACLPSSDGASGTAPSPAGDIKAWGY